MDCADIPVKFKQAGGISLDKNGILRKCISANPAPCFNATNLELVYILMNFQLWEHVGSTI